MLTDKERVVLETLRRFAEGEPDDGWQAVYLDNVYGAKPGGLWTEQVVSVLGSLKKKGFYAPLDDCFGDVKMTDEKPDSGQ